MPSYLEGSPGRYLMARPCWWSSEWPPSRRSSKPANRRLLRGESPSPPPWLPDAQHDAAAVHGVLRGRDGPLRGRTSSGALSDCLDAGRMVGPLGWRGDDGAEPSPPPRPSWSPRGQSHGPFGPRRHGRHDDSPEARRDGCPHDRPRPPRLHGRPQARPGDCPCRRHEVGLQGATRLPMAHFLGNAGM